ncbi:hypothetical protein BGZ65_003822 [Modicella reniformis]|uniref:Uncharacterized protein n=1 Tax=Modicella reniformis TaxID=1440133 RepID=A0A9P6MHM6_9FUNG|nr:hypothetical protein BGZ65_003822 [Modicella reniformis]
MKIALKTLLLLGLTGLQYLSCAQAQSTSSPTRIVQTPAVPTFSNTPGLLVTSTYDGMTVYQDSVVSIIASLADQQPISTINISVAKEDGSANTTIVNVSSGAIVKSTQLWNVATTQYPVGIYILNMIITPNTTVGNPQSQGPAPAATTSTGIPPPAGSPDPIPIPGPPSTGKGPSVYYWQATVHVAAPRTVPNSASGLKHETLNTRGLGMATLLVTAGVAIFGSLLVL